MADPKVKTKRFSLTNEERSKIENIENIIGIHHLETQGLEALLRLELMKVRVRIGIKDNEAPEGYERSVQFDPATAELIVVDAPKPPEPTSPTVPEVPQTERVTDAHPEEHTVH